MNILAAIKSLFAKPQAPTAKPLLHRDDIPFEVVEQIEHDVQEIFTGAKVIFAGDLPEGDPNRELTREAAREVARLIRNCMVRGICLSCRRPYPGIWPPETPDEKAGFRASEWNVSGAEGTDEHDHLVCGECLSDGEEELS